MKSLVIGPPVTKSSSPVSLVLLALQAYESTSLRGHKSQRGRAVILAASPNQLKTAVGAGTGILGEMFLILGVKSK